MVSTLCDIHNISKVETFALVLIEKGRRVLLLKEKILVKIKKIKHVFAMFEFNSLKLRGGEDYVLQYILSGKILATRKIRFEEGTYDFSKFSRKIL